MRRRLFTILSALSLLLCVATVVMWVRSYATCDDWAYQTAGDKLYVVLSLNGHLFLCDVDRKSSRMYPAGWSHSTAPSPTGPWTAGIAEPHEAARVLGIGIIRGAYFRDLAIAYWLLCPLLLISPGMWVRRRRRERQAQRGGRCPICGYDLRATPDRCPECGTPTPAASPASA